MEPTRPAHSATLADSKRADARRNRGAILAAADELFRSRGETVSIHEIANSAGVAIGTVYRHFPSKHAMLAALVSELLDGAAQRVQALPSVDGDAFEQLAKALEIGAVEVASHPLCQAIMDKNSPTGAWALARPARDEFDQAVRPLVEAAHAEGTLRDDVEAADVGGLMAAVCSVVDAGRPRDWRIFLDITVRGLRADGSS